jgi:hypothetical protein
MFWRDADSCGKVLVVVHLILYIPIDLVIIRHSLLRAFHQVFNKSYYVLTDIATGLTDSGNDTVYVSDVRTPWSGHFPGLHPTGIYHVLISVTLPLTVCFLEVSGTQRRDALHLHAGLNW